MPTPRKRPLHSSSSERIAPQNESVTPAKRKRGQKEASQEADTAGQRPKAAKREEVGRSPSQEQTDNSSQKSKVIAKIERKVGVTDVLSLKKSKSKKSKSQAAPQSPKKAAKVKGEEEVQVAKQEKTNNKSKRRRKVAKEEQVKTEDEEEIEVAEPVVKKVKKKRKTKEEKEAEAMPLAARTTGLRMFIGAHVSAAKGVHNTVTNAVHVGGNCFANFLKSQRKWENPPLQDDHKDLFVSNCKEHKYDSSSHVLPHGSYLVNLAQEDPEKAKQAYEAFLDDCTRCEKLGVKLYNFHPGSTGSAPRPSAIGRIASAVNRAHAATKTVVPVLEAMAGSGNVIGSTFEDLRDIISLVDDKSRVGVCIDTCHVHAAGYDLRTPLAFKDTLKKFDHVVGMKYLRALHINDSKAPFASHRDLHQNIGLGFLGLRAFHNVMNEKRFENLPLVLETPIDRKNDEGKTIEDKGVWAREIKLLESLIGMDAESEEFKKMEEELASKGAEERAKYAEAFEKKKEKEKKKAEKSQTKLKLGKRPSTDGEDSET